MYLQSILWFMSYLLETYCSLPSVNYSAFLKECSSLIVMNQHQENRICITFVDLLVSYVFQMTNRTCPLEDILL